ncbi:lipocalin-like domain-containing protein [Halolactibacillus sp. JCM 19043]|uniref:lipocalin-like domain-containing protein n=1 Tax=Halolactibacillus sp. JCM 19043 TaxID=1460638 RepID=UPI001E3C8EF4|nr:glycoside hydrolase family 43 C-terminal domain-containing protein [Halolactibacillus sp. JCM 19043]
MFMNKDGWGVVAPKRYAGETLTDDLTTSDITGTYKFINHGKDGSSDVKESVKITLNDDGTISGATEGTWKQEGYYATLTINDITYEGVFVEVWDELNKQGVLSFTALSDQGVSVWGVQTIEETRTEAEIVDDVLSGLAIPREVTADLDLKTSEAGETTITYVSSNEAVLTSDGKVTPQAGEDVDVDLTVTVTKGDTTKEEVFQLTVVGQREAALISHYAFDGNLSDETGQHPELTPTGEKIDTEGQGVTFEAGVDGEAVLLDGSSGLRFAEGLLDTSSYTVSLFVKPMTFTQHTTVFFGAKSPDEWLSVVPYGHTEQTMVWSGSTSWFDGSASERIEENAWSHLVVVVDNGRLQFYINDEQVFSGEGLPHYFDASSYFALGVNHWDTPFNGLIDEVKIFAGALSEAEVQALSE